MLVSPGAQAQDDGSEAHGAILSEDAFPSASQCAACHEQIYDEWSSSNHAYASISPMFHKFEQAINALTQGTIGAFCVRCHQSAGTTLGEDRDAPLWERSQISREGVSCIVCHRTTPTQVMDAVWTAGSNTFAWPSNWPLPQEGRYIWALGSSGTSATEILYVVGNPTAPRDQAAAYHELGGEAQVVAAFNEIIAEGQ